MLNVLPLAGVRHAQDVVSTIVSTLEIPSPPTGGDPEKLLLGFLRARRALLVLDNFEQVARHAEATLGVWLARAPLAKFIEHNPTLVMLALAFLVMIGVVLIADGFGVHIPKGYIYMAMAFAASVESLNIIQRNRRARARGVRS